MGLLVPNFLVSLSIFVFIILFSKIFDIIEYIIIYNATLAQISILIGYTLLDLLPLILPVALFFTLLFHYTKVSDESEIIALKSFGYSNTHLIAPAFVLTVICFLLSVGVSFKLAPWANKRILTPRKSFVASQVESRLKGETFIEDIHGMVFYIKEFDSEINTLKNIFISNRSKGYTIIAKSGYLEKVEANRKKISYLHLQNGTLHQSKGEKYTRIHFDSNKFKLFEPNQSLRSKKINVKLYNFKELRTALKQFPQKANLIYIEISKRISFAFTCFSFLLLAFSFGSYTNKRKQKIKALTLAATISALYWTVYMICHNLTKSTHPLSIYLSWVPFIAISIFGIISYRKLQKY